MKSNNALFNGSTTATNETVTTNAAIKRINTLANSCLQRGALEFLSESLKKFRFPDGGKRVSYTRLESSLPWGEDSAEISIEFSKAIDARDVKFLTLFLGDTFDGISVPIEERTSKGIIRLTWKVKVYE